MPADLQPVGALADVVGVMDGPAREPEHLLLQFGEDLQIGVSEVAYLRHCPAPAFVRISIASDFSHGWLGVSGQSHSHS